MHNKKHLHVTVAVTKGEHYSHLSDTVATVESHIDLNDAAQIVAKNWQTEPGMYFDDGEWIFEDGMVVKVSKVVEVPPEHFEVFKRYLGEFQIQIETKPKTETNWSRN